MWLWLLRWNADYSIDVVRTNNFLSSKRQRRRFGCNERKIQCPRIGSYDLSQRLYTGMFTIELKVVNIKLFINSILASFSTFVNVHSGKIINTVIPGVPNISFTLKLWEKFEKSELNWRWAYKIKPIVFNDYFRKSWIRKNVKWFHAAMIGIWLENAFVQPTSIKQQNSRWPI